MAQTFVFIACAGGGTVDTLGLDPSTGHITPLSRVEGLPRVTALTLDPAGTLYAGVNGDPRRTVPLALDSATGRATPGPARDVPARTCFLSLGPDRRALYSASYHEGLMVGYQVPGEGRAEAEGGPVTEYRSGPNTHSAVPSPDGRFVYTASLGADRISWFPIHEDHAGNGAVVHPAGHVEAAPGSGPRFLRHTADGRRVYVSHERTGNVDVYTRDAETGGLTLLQRISSVEGLGLVPGPVRSPSTPDPGPGVIWCADIRLTPDEKFLYVTERSTSTIAAFALAPDGRLTYLRRSETEAQPRIIAVDPSGRWLLAAGERSNHVTVYAIGPDGELDPVSRAATAADPLWIECWRPSPA
ncbi:lactonase family protein [Sinomonas notoginsengisoli]|uniref:lactonase family protein n=1 Tax=Sinomonas notoginsengisoli TaxID=1457311 RepID=UPI001F239C6D|nr:beta-propeller fold lactonase family protein [Sinomonas notoginsengisoli]